MPRGRRRKERPPDDELGKKQSERLTLVVNRNTDTKLTLLGKELELNKSQVVRQGIHLLDAYVHAQKEGKRVCIIDASGETSELLLI